MPTVNHRILEDQAHGSEGFGLEFKQLLVNHAGLRWPRTLLFAIIVVGAYWFFHSLGDHLLFSPNSIREAFIPERHELIMRLETSAILFVLTILMIAYLRTRDHTIKRLSVQRDFFLSSLDNVDDALVILGSRDQIKYMNKAALRMFQPPPEYHGMKIGDLFVVVADESNGPNECPSSPGSDRIIAEKRIRLQNGEKLTVRMARNTFSHLDLKGSRTTMISVEDLGPLKEAERSAQLERARSIAADKQRYLSSMAADMAHEMNQPLSGVRGLAEHILLAIERDWNFNKEDVSARLTRLLVQVDRISDMIEHVRTLSNSQDQQETVFADVNSLVEQTISICRARLRSHGIDLSLNLRGDLPKLKLNPFSLERALLSVIQNSEEALLANASAHNDDTPKISLATTMDREENRDIVFLHITDNGHGMTKEILENAVDPFFSTRRPGKNVGLGLTMARAISEENGGSLELNSEPGAGTHVVIKVPVSEENADFDK